MTKKTAAAAVSACFLCLGQSAFAHRIDEYLQATIFSVEANRVQASMRLIPGVLVASSVIAGIDGDRDGAFSDQEERTYAQRVLDDLAISIDGKSVRPKLVSWSFPQPAQMRDGLGEIHVEYSVDLPAGSAERTLTVANHHLSSGSVYLMNVLTPEDSNIRILAQKRNEQQSVYELEYEQMAVSSGFGGVREWFHGLQFATLFRLGMRHIAEGTDHLLFLLVLLLPAPLLVKDWRWGRPRSARQSLLRILGIVTAFTIGHSITLTLAAMGAVNVPGRPIEVLIAVSIFISALHALRPIFPGKEALIAGFFGLIHGLAFAATLQRLGLGRWERFAGILSFNLGIEAMQMLVVAMILPSLMLMSRTPVYPLLRMGGAVFAGVASLGWIAERLFDQQTPVDTVVNGFARHGLLLAGGLLVLSLSCNPLVTEWFEKRMRSRGELRCSPSELG